MPKGIREVYMYDGEVITHFPAEFEVNTDDCDSRDDSEQDDGEPEPESSHPTDEEINRWGNDGGLEYNYW